MVQGWKCKSWLNNKIKQCAWDRVEKTIIFKSGFKIIFLHCKISCFFSHERVVITQFKTNCWFHVPIYAKWLALMQLSMSLKWLLTSLTYFLSCQTIIPWMELIPFQKSLINSKIINENSSLICQACLNLAIKSLEQLHLSSWFSIINIGFKDYRLYPMKLFLISVHFQFFSYVFFVAFVLFGFSNYSVQCLVSNVLGANGIGCDSVLSIYIFRIVYIVLSQFRDNSVIILVSFNGHYISTFGHYIHIYI